MTDTNGGRSGRSVAVLGARWAGNALATICALVLAFAMCMAGLVAVPSAVADETATTVDETGSITVDYKYGDDPIAGAKVNLYHVANWSDASSFTPTESFKDAQGSEYSWNIANATATTFRTFAAALSGYIDSHSIKADESMNTSSEGQAIFGDSAKGLYLVRIDAYSDDNITCGSSYALVAVPSKYGSNVDTDLKVLLSPKNDCKPNTTPPTPPTETVKKKVVKVWKGDADAKRPSKVVVQLLQDGKVIDEVELNASNNWTHEWTNLPAGHEYQAVEKTVPDNYTVLVDRENDVITITNTYTPPTPPTPPGDHNPPSDNTPPSKKTPPIGETGSNVVIAAICAGVLGGLGVILLVHRKRKAK